MSHRVTLEDTGAAFDVAAGESVLAAAGRAGVRLPHACTLGGCGACRVRLAAGSVAYDAWPLALSEDEAAQGYALACQARPQTDLVIAVERVPVAEPSRQCALITGLEPLGPQVMHLELLLPELDRFEFLPGQHMNIHLGDGRQRSFSMASPPSGNALDFHVRRIDGGHFSGRVLAQLNPGDLLDVELPLGRFRFHADDYRELVMVATGTGLAPIKSMLEALFDDSDCPPVSLYWGARDETWLYLADAIRGWSERLYEFRFHPVLSRPRAGWQGRTGYVQDAVAHDFPDLSEHSIYLCGSPTMIRDAKRTFLARGASVDHLYAEGFNFQVRA